MRVSLASTVLAIFVFAAIFLSCSDNPPLEFPGEEVISSSSNEAKIYSSSSVKSSSSSSSLSETSGTFTDIRDDNSYKWVKIGTQTWMAENLNYNANNSKCYLNEPTNCAKFGRLYYWETAKTVCPTGWHLPTDVEWGVLMQFLNSGCSLTEDCPNAGKLLKAISGWNSNGNGTDKYGFAALPGGSYSGSDNGVGSYGEWWSATAASSVVSYVRIMNYNSDSVKRVSTNARVYLFSVRCLKDS